MNEEIIRKKYQREDENDPRGVNTEAMDRFIQMLRQHQKSEDPRIVAIADNFENISKLAPNFTIFQTDNPDNCMFMPKFKVYQIAKDSNMMTASHEFGHAVLSIMNDTKVPENYGEVIARAKQHSISSENKKYFMSYVEYLCGKTENKEDRTEAEKGPLSDIMSSIFQRQGLRIGTPDNVCLFPAYHSREYYFDEKNGEPNQRKIFDEDFANYYVLKVNNCTQEIETIRRLFGDEFINVLDAELEKAYERILILKEKETQERQPDIMEQIESAIIGSRQSEIDEARIIQNEERETKESQGERSE